jgi:hypothetical protein
MSDPAPIAVSLGTDNTLSIARAISVGFELLKTKTDSIMTDNWTPRGKNWNDQGYASHYVIAELPILQNLYFYFASVITRGGDCSLRAFRIFLCIYVGSPV